MPPLAFFKNPWDLPEESDSSYEERKAFVIWYHDHFLPACAGKDFKEEIRHFRMPVQMMTIAGENPGAHVTKESEALGLIIVENCYEKWTHIVPEKAKDDEWVIPAFKKSDRSTHKYHKPSGVMAGPAKLRVVDGVRKPTMPCISPLFPSRRYERMIEATIGKR